MLQCLRWHGAPLSPPLKAAPWRAQPVRCAVGPQAALLPSAACWALSRPRHQGCTFARPCSQALAQSRLASFQVPLLHQAPPKCTSTINNPVSTLACAQHGSPCPTPPPALCRVPSNPPAPAHHNPPVMHHPLGCTRQPHPPPAAAPMHTASLRNRMQPLAAALLRSTPTLASTPQPTAFTVWQHARSCIAGHA